MRRDPLKSSLSGVAHIVVNTALMLIIVPVFIGRLGIETYGIYALIMAVGNLGTFTNFGFNTSLIKHLVEQKDRRASNNDIWVTFTVIASTSLTVVACLLIFEQVVVTHVLDLGPAVYDDSARSFYVASLLSGAFLVIAQVPSAVLDARQKVYLTNGVQLVAGVLGKGSILISLVIAPDLATVGWITLAAQVFAFFSLSALARWTWGSLYAAGLWSNFAGVARKHFAYGRSIYASSIMFFFYEPMTKILIGRFIGVTEVGFFDIALRVKGAVWSVMERLLYPVLPLIATKEEPSEVRSVIEEVQQKLLLIVLPLVVATAYLSGPVISVWLRTDLTEIVLGTILVVSTSLVTLTFVPLYQFLLMKGHPEKTLILQSVNVFVNVAVFAAAVPVMGYFGAIAAYCTAAATSTLLCAWYQWSILRSFPIPSARYAVQVLKIVLSLVVVNLLLSQLPLAGLARTVMLVCVNAGLTVAFLRVFRMITVADIERYIGRQSRMARLVERILVHGSGA